MKHRAEIPSELMFPARVIFENGAVSRLLREACVFGSRGVLVHGKSLEDNGILSMILSEKPKEMEVLAWRYSGGEPKLADVESLRKTALDFKADWIAGVGGGSVLDTAKAAAGLLTSNLPVLDYHDGKPLPWSKTPFLAVPTTAGTGSEATSVCVLTNQETGVKKSFRHPSLFARLVILDPTLLKSCPDHVLAASGMDALTQAIEAFISKYASCFSDLLATTSVRLLWKALPASFRCRQDNNLADLMAGSFLAGMALSHARLGVVHGLAHSLGARYNVPHGLVCAVCLPMALEFNRPVIEEKYKILSDLFGDDPLKSVVDLLSNLKMSSPFPPVAPTDQEAIIAETLASGSTKANPRPVSRNDVIWFLNRLFGCQSR